MESEEHTMSYDGSGYLKAELAYRAQRISATTHGRRSTVRVPRVRRPARSARSRRARSRRKRHVQILPHLASWRRRTCARA